MEMDTSLVKCNKKKICQINITCSTPDVKKVVRSLNNSLPSNVWLWVTIPLTQDSFMSCLQNFANAGFSGPYIVDRTPFEEKIEHSLALTRQNKGQLHTNPTRTLLNAMYILQQYRKNGCSLYARFNSKAISFLRETSMKGHTANGDHTITQKELGGNLYVENVQKSGHRYVFVIGVDEDHVEPGIEEEVTISPTRYNFHSHPKEAYVRHSVKHAWPSLTDYFGYLKLGTSTIFHCVATLEGIYIMSFGQYWVDKLEKVSKKFIEEHYDIDHKENITPFQYVKHVNNIKYENHPIFIVRFLPWNKAAKTIFSVRYAKQGFNCFPGEDILGR